MTNQSRVLTVHLALVGHEEQRLGAPGDGDRVEGGEDVREDGQLDLGALQTPELVLVVEAPDEGLDGVLLLLGAALELGV